MDWCGQKSSSGPVSCTQDESEVTRNGVLTLAGDRWVREEMIDTFRIFSELIIADSYLLPLFFLTNIQIP